MKTFYAVCRTLLCVSVLLVGCTKEKESYYPDSGTGSGAGFDCLPDPPGTKISTGSSDGRNGQYENIYPEATGRIHFDDNNIMTGGEFLVVGRVRGLSDVRAIPSDAVWSYEVSVVPGYGYIQRCEKTKDSKSEADEPAAKEYVYCRLYRIYSVGSVGGVGGRIVNVFKHQSPFIP